MANPETTPIPIDRLLVPPASAAVPAGLELLHVELRQALPFPIDLGAAGTLLLVAATGHAVRWRDAAADAIVSTSAPERAPAGPRTPAVPLQLILRQGGATLGMAPLVAGRRALLPAGAPALELVVLDWELRAGNLRGAATVGSFVRLAWRKVGRGSDRFEPPALHPEVVRRG